MSLLDAERVLSAAPSEKPRTPGGTSLIRGSSDVDETHGCRSRCRRSARQPRFYIAGMSNALQPARISQHDMAPHIGQRDQSWFSRHGEDVGGFVTCTLLSVCFAFLATIFALPAFEADIGLLGSATR